MPVVGTIASADSTVPGTEPPVTPRGSPTPCRQAAEDQSVAAVVLEVNSPGGGHGERRDAPEHPRLQEVLGQACVVVSMGDTAASGGYYISTAADKIVANETTLTGSLGVIFSLTNISELADKYGVKQEVVKSGKFKDMGSSFRELTPEEREILQSIVDESYDEFVSVIVKGATSPKSGCARSPDGRVYSGEQARELGLVDSFGGLDEAAEISEDLAGVDEGDRRPLRAAREPSPTTLWPASPRRKPEVLQIAEEADSPSNPNLTISTCLEPREGRLERSIHHHSASDRRRGHQGVPASLHPTLWRLLGSPSLHRSNRA